MTVETVVQSWNLLTTYPSRIDVCETNRDRYYTLRTEKEMDEFIKKYSDEQITTFEVNLENGAVYIGFENEEDEE